MWTYAAAAVAAVGAIKLYMKATTVWCNIDADLSDKVFIITGAASGIGKATALELAKHGATVNLADVNLAAGEQVTEEIRNTTGNDKVKIWKLDLQSLKSVREFASNYLDSGQPIHVLINNAGVGGFSQKQITEDGFEKTMATNYFGAFLLTSLLLDDINFEKSLYFSEYWAYCRSKLACVMFTRELSRRLQDTGVTVYSLHPGTVGGTNLFSQLFPWFSNWLGIGRFFQKTPLEGAQTTLYLSTTANIEHTTGMYYSDCKPKAMNKVALDDDLNRQLFDLSSRLTGANWH